MALWPWPFFEGQSLCFKSCGYCKCIYWSKLEFAIFHSYRDICKNKIIDRWPSAMSRSNQDVWILLRIVMSSALIYHQKHTKIGWLTILIRGLFNKFWQSGEYLPSQTNKQSEPYIKWKTVLLRLEICKTIGDITFRVTSSDVKTNQPSALWQKRWRLK